MFEISPSNLARREACPASAKMEFGIADASSPDSEKGTLKHAIVEEMIDGNLDAIDKIENEDDKASVDYAMTVISQVLAEFDEKTIQTEATVDLSCIGIPPKEGRCRIDVLAFSPDRYTALIGDFKFGVVPVAVTNNPQFEAYAVGIFNANPKVKEIELVKIQPDALDFKRFETTTMTRREAMKAKTKLKKIVKAAQSSKAKMIPGDHCGYCKARETCPARAAIIDSLPAHRTFSELLPSMTADERGTMYSRALIVEKWIGDLKEAARTFACDGGEIAGYRVAPGRKSRSWSDELTALATMTEIAKRDGIDPDALVEQKIASPALAEKILGKGHTELMPLIETTEGSPVLKEDKS